MRSKTDSGISIKWLSDSSNKEISRMIDIRQNDITANFGSGIEILSNHYSAHNIKINIAGNNINRNLKEGILI